LIGEGRLAAPFFLFRFFGGCHGQFKLAYFFGDGDTRWRVHAELFVEERLLALSLLNGNVQPLFEFLCFWYFCCYFHVFSLSVCAALLFGSAMLHNALPVSTLALGGCACVNVLRADWRAVKGLKRSVP